MTRLPRSFLLCIHYFRPAMADRCWLMCRQTCRKLDQVKVVGSDKVTEMWTRCALARVVCLPRVPAHRDLTDPCLKPCRDVPRIKNKAFVSAFKRAVDQYVKGDWITASLKVEECLSVSASIRLCLCTLVLCCAHELLLVLPAVCVCNSIYQRTPLRWP